MALPFLGRGVVLLLFSLLLLDRHSAFRENLATLIVHVQVGLSVLEERLWGCDVRHELSAFHEHVAPIFA